MSTEAMPANNAALGYSTHSEAEHLPTGYRRTNVGVIPGDWLTATCEGLIDRGSPICYGVVQVGSHVDGGVPIVAIKFLKEIATAPLHCASAHIERAYLRSRVKPGDVLLSIKGTIGHVGIVPEGFEGNISRELARLRPRPVVMPRYLAHQLECGGTQGRISRAVVGTTRLEFSIAALRKFEIPLPPTLAEQRAIAEALSDVDGLLGALDALIAKKWRIKQATMQQLLTGKARLPGFGGEWEARKLGEIAEVSKGMQLQDSAVREQGNFPHLNGGISPSGYVDTFNTPANTIAISEGGNSCGYVQFMEDSYWCGGHCYSVRPRETDNKFLYYALKVMQSAIMDLRVGSGLPNVQKPAILGIEVVGPVSKAEQAAIAMVLSDMDAEIRALERRRNKTRDIKQGMMQQLLTGRIRLVNPKPIDEVCKLEGGTQ